MAVPRLRYVIKKNGVNKSAKVKKIISINQLKLQGA